MVMRAGTAAPPSVRATDMPRNGSGTFIQRYSRLAKAGNPSQRTCRLKPEPDTTVSHNSTNRSTRVTSSRLASW